MKHKTHVFDSLPWSRRDRGIWVNCVVCLSGILFTRGKICRFKSLILGKRIISIINRSQPSEGIYFLGSNWGWITERKHDSLWLTVWNFRPRDVPHRTEGLHFWIPGPKKGGTRDRQTQLKSKVLEFSSVRDRPVSRSIWKAINFSKKMSS